jgi:hypothetical protein
MLDLFDAESRQSIVDRIVRLRPDSPRQWGKMSGAQMLAHCVVPLDASANRGSRQKLFGRLLSPLVRKKILGSQPFSHNAPTDPDFVVKDERDFATEKARLVSAIERFVERGPEAAATAAHPFFGRMSGLEWGGLMYKHLDHHLRQFGG